MKLIGLDKHPGIRPVGVGERCNWMINKCMFAVVVTNRKEYHSMYQIYAGMEVSHYEKRIIHILINSAQEIYK